jgi:hypothetical protein
VPVWHRPDPPEPEAPGAPSAEREPVQPDDARELVEA